MNIQHSAFSIQHSAFSIQHSAFSILLYSTVKYSDARNESAFFSFTFSFKNVFGANGSAVCTFGSSVGVYDSSVHINGSFVDAHEIKSIHTTQPLAATALPLVHSGFPLLPTALPLSCLTQPNVHFSSKNK